MWRQRLMWTGWPAFLVAGVLEIMVFAVVDPQSLHWLGHALALPRQGVYTLAFFAFWLVAALGNNLTLLLAQPVPDSTPSDGWADPDAD